MADVTGSYRVPFFCTGGITLAALALVWAIVHEDFTPPKTSGRSKSMVSGLRLLTGILRAAGTVSGSAHGTIQRAHRAAGGHAFVQELIGSPPEIATLAGMAFSVTGLADLISSRFSANAAT